MPFLRQDSVLWGELVELRRRAMSEERIMRSTTATLLAMKTPRIAFLRMGRALDSRPVRRVSMVSRT